MQIRGWSREAQVYLDNNLLGSIGSRGTFSSIPPGNHEIKVVDKQGESSTMQKSFAPGELAKLTKKDFPPSNPLTPPQNPPLKPAESDLWPQVAKSGSIDQLEQYRAQNPNSPHQGDLEAQLDDLYW